jgi:Divergent CRAL/TRIO domain
MTWTLSAYQSLGRKYRKGIKKLFIVHSGTWTRIVLEVAGRVVSPKFAKKIKYVGTLSELAEYVPLTQVVTPPPSLFYLWGINSRLIFPRQYMFVMILMRGKLLYLLNTILFEHNCLEWTCLV